MLIHPLVVESQEGTFCQDLTASLHCLSLHLPVQGTVASRGEAVETGG